MKYDSGMTHFKNDITAALQHMLGNNSEITKKFSPNDGSPAPLRDYLKEKYGKSYTSHIGNGMRYSCKTSTGFELMFDTILNNPGDKNLTLSWSQTAKFIRDNWDEVFKKDKPKTDPIELSAEKQPSDLDESTVPQIGDYVSEDMLGELLTFDELAEMEGQLVIDDRSTESKNWYMVVQVGKVTQSNNERRLMYKDNPKTKNNMCSIGEWAFNENGTHILGGKEVTRSARFWRLKQTPQNKVSYIDKLREKYPKVNETDEWFDTVFCPSDLFIGKNVKNAIDEDCHYTTIDQEACQKCWRSPCSSDAAFYDILDDFEEEYYSHYPAEDTVETDEAVPEISEDTSEADKPPENQITTTTETALQVAFDYSELDNDTAKNLRECETIIRQETAGYFTLLGAKFKEAQALLANHASGTFEKWYTAMGFKRQTVYNLIQRYDFLGSPTIGGREDTFEALPLTLSYEVSKPDAPAELVEKVLDGDITTNAEYLKLKAELERTREECRQLDANLAAKDKEYERQLEEANKRAETERKARESISYNLDNMEKGYVEFKDKYADEYYKNAELEKRIKELENRPVDVAVQDNSELMEELEQLREENKRLKDDNIKSFLIRLTMDEFEGLINALDSKPQLQDIIKRAEIIKL